MRGAGGGPIALLPWGDVIEDYLEPIGMTVDDFTDRQQGGWLFGYVDALAAVGVGCVIVAISRSVDTVERRRHHGTGAPLVLLPASAAYRRTRTLVDDPYAWTARSAAAAGVGPSRRIVGAVAWALLPWLATPLWQLRRLLVAEGCSALLCQEYEHGRFDVCVLVGRSAGIPVFGTFQGGNHRRTHLERAVRQPSMRAAAGLLVGASMERRRLEGQAGLPPVHDVPSPLDLSVWRPAEEGEQAAARAALGLELEVPTAVWHGRVEIVVKGLDLLVEAWSEVRRRPGLGSAQLLLVGSGPGDEDLRGLLADAGEVGITWRDGYVLDPAEIRRALVAADVAVLSSRQEGFPVAPLEAMACGLPVVATDIAAATDILGTGPARGGVLVPSGDSVALAAAISELLADPARRQVAAAAALDRARTHFSRAAVGRTLVMAMQASGTA